MSTYTIGPDLRERGYRRTASDFKREWQSVIGGARVTETRGWWHESPQTLRLVVIVFRLCTWGRRGMTTLCKWRVPGKYKAMATVTAQCDESIKSLNNIVQTQASGKVLIWKKVLEWNLLRRFKSESVSDLTDNSRTSWATVENNGAIVKRMQRKRLRMSRRELAHCVKRTWIKRLKRYVCDTGNEREMQASYRDVEVWKEDKKAEWVARVIWLNVQSVIEIDYKILMYRSQKSMKRIEEDENPKLGIHRCQKNSSVDKIFLDGICISAVENIAVLQNFGRVQDHNTF